MTEFTLTAREIMETYGLKSLQSVKNWVKAGYMKEKKFPNRRVLYTKPVGSVVSDALARHMCGGAKLSRSTRHKTLEVHVIDTKKEKDRQFEDELLARVRDEGLSLFVIMLGDTEVLVINAPLTKNSVVTGNAEVMVW